MLDLQSLEKYFDENSCSDNNSISSALKVFGLDDETCLRAVEELEEKCCDNKVSISKNFKNLGNDIMAFKVNFSIFDGFKVSFEIKASISNEYVNDECIVSLNEISKYRGSNLKAAIEEAGSLVEEGISKKEGYKVSSNYKCSLFKIKYLCSFKNLLESRDVDKSKVETLLKGIKCLNAFVTDSFVRSTYSFGKAKFSIDMFDDGRIELKTESDDGESEFSSSDMSACIKHLYDTFFG